jgi:drug/metabolite transporter (DMT)-like permease
MLGSFSGIILVALSKILVTPAVDDGGADAEIPVDAPVEVEEETSYVVGVMLGLITAMCFSLLGVATRKL